MWERAQQNSRADRHFDVLFMLRSGVFSIKANWCWLLVSESRDPCRCSGGKAGIVHVAFGVQSQHEQRLRMGEMLLLWASLISLCSQAWGWCQCSSKGWGVHFTPRRAVARILSLKVVWGFFQNCLTNVFLIHLLDGSLNASFGELTRIWICLEYI